MIASQNAEPEEESPQVNFYLEDNFKKYVREKYYFKDEQLLSQPQVLQMIYALEWFDVPRTAYSDLVEFHPYLTEADHDRLFYVNTQHRIENAISWLLFSMVGNRVMNTRGPALFQRRLVRAPAAMLFGGAIAYAMNKVVLKPIYLHDLDEMGLCKKYFDLDLNADMMKQDLEGLGISIEARHFDLEKAQARVDAQSEPQRKDL